MSNTIEQMKANRKLWVEALRSGKYQQARGVLKARDGVMCCLGVLADIAGYDWREYDRPGADDCAPPIAVDFVGLLDANGHWNGDGKTDCLAIQNDEGHSFYEIADIIESEPEDLFVSEVKP